MIYLEMPGASILVSHLVFHEDYPLEKQQVSVEGMSSALSEQLFPSHTY